MNPDNLRAEQLRMFIPAKELRALPANPHDRYDSEGVQQSDDYTYTAKFRQSRERGLYESIKSEGVKMPVGVYHSEEGEPTVPHYPAMSEALPGGPVLAQGHHRVAVAGKVSPEALIPVKHYSRESRFPGRWPGTPASTSDYPFAGAVQDAKDPGEN